MIRSITKRCVYIVAIFLVITSICNGQSRFSIEIGAGMAMPIGEFSMNKPEQAMMYGWELAPNIPLGLQKKKVEEWLKTGSS